MTPVSSTESPKKSTKTQQRKRKRRPRKGKKRRTRVILAQRLEKYRRLLAETKADHAIIASQFKFRVTLPGDFQAFARQIVSSAASLPQIPLPPSQINPQLAMSGNCFWLNYQSVFQWKDRHMDPSGRYSSAQPIARHVNPTPNPKAYQKWNGTPSEGVNAPFNGEAYMNSSTTGSEYCEGEDKELDGESGRSEQTEEVYESDEDIVVTEEMMQFLEISMRHKATREREKQAAKEQEKIKRIEERDAIEDCQVPTEEDENEKRLREMVELYGEEAAKIHGMETALQLNFNRQLDLFDPSYWPFYPFSMQFQGATALK